MADSAHSLIGWLATAAGEVPTQPALCDNTGTLSYAALWDALGRWRHTYIDLGLKAHAPVAVISRHRHRIARATWLAVYAGFPMLPLGPSQLGLAGLMRSCGIHQAIADADVELPGGIRRLPAARLDQLPAGESAGPTPLRANRAQLLVSTAGTEARPRAAMLSGDNLVSSTRISCAALELQSDDNWLLCLPLTHIAGLMILFRCASVGAAVTIHDFFDASAIQSEIAEGRLTRLSLVPPMVDSLMTACAEGPASGDKAAVSPADMGDGPGRIRTVIIGGAPIATALAERAGQAGWPLRASYGMTETSSHVALSSSRLEDGLQPLPESHIEIADDTGGPLTSGGSGRILISGPTVMLGYANPALLPGEGLLAPGKLLTRDLGEIDQHGALHVAGRSDDVLISGGVNVQPAALEDLLAGCPGVVEAGVSGRPDPVWGHRLIAVYAGDASRKQLAEWVERHIAPNLRPREFMRVSSLPRNALGKLDRRLLKLLVAAPADDDR
ncbi:MAG: class I adenylate-forming enzyme family protein [Gammaproteobacteria bacterium]